MYFDLFFDTSLDDEDEVNSKLAMFTEACQAAYEASKSKIYGTTQERDRRVLIDRLVIVVTSSNRPHINEVYFRNSSIGNIGRAFMIPDEYPANEGYIRNGGLAVHEAARKDVKQAFGVLKQKWKIIKYPARGMTRSGLSDIMYTCLILHNMIVHDNGNAISPEFFPEEQHRDDDPVRTHQEKMYGGKEEDVGLDELGEGGKGVVSKIGEFGRDLGSELFGDREGE
ncbi:ALP1-like protein [Tanacetum coccineum]